MRKVFGQYMEIPQYLRKYGDPPVLTEISLNKRNLYQIKQESISLQNS